MTASHQYTAERKQVSETRRAGVTGAVNVRGDVIECNQAEALLREQTRLLERIALGCPQEECLTELTDAVARLHPRARACVLMANSDRTALADAYSAHLQPSFGAGIRDAPINELAIGTCGTAIYEGKPVSCTDIAHAEQWSEPWRNLCIAHGILACHSTPVFDADGKAVASFFLCFAEAREPNVWEHRIAEFGAHVASIVIERDRAAQQLRQSRAQMETELADTKLLQEISIELIQEEDAEALYQKLVDAAVVMMHSDLASMQMLYPERGRGGELRLLANHGYTSEAERYWEWVSADTASSCGEVLRTGRQVIIPDVEKCPFIAGTAALEAHLKAGLRAVHSTPLRSRDGKLVGMISTHWRKPHQPSERDLRRLDILVRQAADLIERRRVQEALRQQAEALKEADRKKDEFLAMLAHELRNPLAPIRNGLQVMKLARNDTAAIEQSRVVMERQVEQMVRLIDDLLDVSRITQGKIELHKERIELTDVIGTALESCQPIINQHGHELTVTLPDEPIYVDGDKIRLAQVLCNLLNNAAKYTEKAGQICLTVERQGNDAILSVRDNGIGIPAAMLPKVFDLFTQVDRSLEKSQGGLGIGLTIVKRLIEMHGGCIEARSDGPGQGCEFVIRLPAAPSRNGEQLSASDGKPDRATSHRRILVVDDNVDSANSLALMLQMLGNEVRTAHDGLEGVSAAAEFRPDVILLDIGMPKLNGYDAARRIRQHPWGRTVVLAALTGWGQEEDKRRAQEAGFNVHLVKPVNLAALQNLLAQPQRKPGVGITSID